MLCNFFLFLPLPASSFPASCTLSVPCPPPVHCLPLAPPPVHCLSPAPLLYTVCPLPPSCTLSVPCPPPVHCLSPAPPPVHCLSPAPLLYTVCPLPPPVHCLSPAPPPVHCLSPAPLSCTLSVPCPPLLPPPVSGMFTFLSCSALSSRAACFSSLIRYSTLVCRCLSCGFKFPRGRIYERKKGMYKTSLMSVVPLVKSI